jgi:hypothetical protein
LPYASPDGLWRFYGICDTIEEGELADRFRETVIC